jgi:hypothetical protein
MNFGILMVNLNPSFLEQDYQEFNVLLKTIKNRTLHTRILKAEKNVKDSQFFKKQELDILEDDVEKVLEILSKTLEKEINPMGKGVERAVVRTICEILDFIQVNFHNDIIKNKFQDNKDYKELELQYKILLNFSRVNFLDSMQEKLREFLDHPTNPDQLSKIEIPKAFQYYKDKIGHSWNGFKTTYKIISDRNDDLSVWLAQQVDFDSLHEFKNDKN